VVIDLESEKDSLVGDELLLETLNKETRLPWLFLVRNKWLIPCPSVNNTPLSFNNNKKYLVQSPETSHDVPMQEEQEATRFRSRLQGHANMDIMDKVVVISKNRKV
jgi:hypothetical protein